MMIFIVPGPPVPYTRMTRRQVEILRIPEHRRNTSLPKQIQRYLDYKAWVQAHAMNAGCHPLEGPVLLSVSVRLPGHTVRRWDTTNVLKGVEDALNGLCYRDDRQVECATIDLRYGALDTSVLVRVGTYEP